jgi:ribosome-binding protein aMBF1 (putative translation factor)
MPSRSYDDFAAGLRAEWCADVHEVRDKLAAQLEAEVAERIRLGEQIASLRRHRHLTQGKLAALSSVRQPEISRIERGLANPTADTLTKLATAMGARLTVAPDDTSSMADREPAPSA